MENNSKMKVANKLEMDQVLVKPRIGLLGGMSFIVGGIVGSGIFISPKEVFLHGGSVGLTLLVWTFGGVMAFILGLVYAELGVLVPKSGGGYTYILVAIGDAPAFLVAWIQTVITQPGSQAVLSLVFADYVCAPIFGNCDPPDAIRKSISVLALVTLAITNIVSVRFAATVQILFTAGKVVALLIISFGGFVFLFQGHVGNFENSFEGSNLDIGQISLAIYSCVWAYSGYFNMNQISEEIIDPRKNFPRGIIISVIVVTIIYLTTNASYITLLTREEFISASAVAFVWGEKVLKSGSLFIPICVVCSVYGTMNGGFFSDSRTRFAASRAGHLPEILSCLHPKSRIPIAAVMFNTVCAIIFIIPGDVSELINMVAFVGFLIEGGCVLSLFILRRRQRIKVDENNRFSLPIVVPMMASVICVFMLLSPFISSPQIEFLYGAALVLAGLLLYFPFVYFRFKLPGFGHFTLFLQLLLNVCPTVQDRENGLS